MRSTDAPLPHHDAGDERPSKTQRKKASHELQDLGEALVGLPADRIAGFPLPDPLRDAVEEFRRLLSLSANTVELSFEAPSQEAYLLAGQRVADMSDLVVAVWDGAVARGKGGTGDIVAYSQRRGKPVFQIDPRRRTCGMLP